MKSAKHIISYTILVLINFIFAYKYLPRYSDYGLSIAVAILILQSLFYICRSYIKLPVKLYKLLLGSYSIYLLSIIVIGHFKIPLETLNVDRHSVISSFLIELSKGNYPYLAVSHLGNYPGPMPVYFLIAMPFYYFGELSLLSAFGFFVIAIIIRNKYENTYLLFYLLTSLFLIWEVTTRSNIFSYSTLVLCVLSLFTKIDFENRNKLILIAILLGASLATRSVFIIAYIIFLLPVLFSTELKLNRKIPFFLTIAISFTLTFLPFLLLFPEDFFEMNPFIVQSSFLIPTKYIALFILLAVVSTVFIRTNEDKFFYSGLVLFASILIYFIYHCVINTFYESIFNNIVDISYFLFCVPFFIKYLSDADTELILADN